MKKSRPLIFIAALAFAMASILSCSSDSSSGNPIKKAKISGVSQKGPFMEGSKATLYELNDSFEQTGRSFADIIADDRGSFEIRNVELVSPYAILEADGYYRNENTGGESGPIKLFAIADLREKDQVNVNVLTHIEYHRVLALVDQGKTVKEAKRQAQKEIFAVFGIDSDDFKDSEDMSVFGNSESDAALLAISVLLLGDLSEGEFSQRLTNFAQAIKNGGAWNNEGAKAAMAEWAWGTEGLITEIIKGEPNSHCYYGQDNCWPMPTRDMCVGGTLIAECPGRLIIKTDSLTMLDVIKSNILEWGLSSEVPAFEKYINNYWSLNYGWGVCNAGTNKEIKINDESVFYGIAGNFGNFYDMDVYYICLDNSWQRAKNLETYCLSGLCDVFTDPRDNNKYRTMKINDKTFMIDALRYVGEDGDVGFSFEDKIVYSDDEAEIVCPDGWYYDFKNNVHFSSICSLDLNIILGLEMNCNYGGYGPNNEGRKYVYCVKN